jgi:hypothetical protein
MHTVTGDQVTTVGLQLAEEETAVTGPRALLARMRRRLRRSG